MTPSPLIRGLPIVVAVAGFVALMAAGARVDVPVPGSPVPQSLQSLAVLAAGLALGPRWGAVAALVYLGLGAAGLPVFADGHSGLDVFTGPTAGYLLAFPPAAALAGMLVRPGQAVLPDLAMTLVAALAGHGLILTLGWAGLALKLGAAAAFSAGVAPFLWGMMAKSLTLAALSPLLLRPRLRLNI